jgi:lipopolysaccharide biosynthesis regulator YciM
LKVRGTFNTRDEAEKRAKKLQTIDSDFHVFVGQVGYWLPWDPCADQIEDESFINSQLNDMMEKYKENNINKDMFYEEQKREKIKAAREEVIRKKKEQAAAKKLENLSEDPIAEGEEEEKEVEPEPEPEEPEKVEVIEESVGDCKKELDEDLKKSLDEVDPWMANKLKSQ